MISLRDFQLRTLPDTLYNNSTVEPRSQLISHNNVIHPPDYTEAIFHVGVIYFDPFQVIFIPK